VIETNSRQRKFPRGEERVADKLRAGAGRCLRKRRDRNKQAVPIKLKTATKPAAKSDPDGQTELRDPSMNTTAARVQFDDKNGKVGKRTLQVMRLNSRERSDRFAANCKTEPAAAARKKRGRTLQSSQRRIISTLEKPVAMLKTPPSPPRTGR